MKVRLHPLFLAYALTVTVLGGFFILIASLFAVFLHEAAHARAAASRGYRLDDITLMPYGASLKICGRLAEKDALVVLSAGIIANFVFVIMTAALWWLIPEAYPYTYPLVNANIVIGGINLLPCLPLDGGRLFDLMIKNKKLKTFVNLAAGILTIALFIALFIVSCFTKINFSFLVFALFLGSYMMFPPSRSTLEIFSKKQDFAEVCEVVINEKTPLYRIMRKAEQRRYSRFTVTDKKGGKLGTIEEGDLSLLALKYPADAAAAELLKQGQDNS